MDVARPVSMALRNKVNFTNYATKLSQNYCTTGFRHFSGKEHPSSVILKSIFHEKLLQNSGIWRGNRVTVAIFRVHIRHARDLIKLGTTSIFCHFWYFVINFSKTKFPLICYKNLDNDKLIITRFCLQHFYSLIILWIFIYICRHILLISIDSFTNVNIA